MAQHRDALPTPLYRRSTIVCCADDRARRFEFRRLHLATFVSVLMAAAAACGTPAEVVVTGNSPILALTPATSIHDTVVTTAADEPEAPSSAPTPPSSEPPSTTMLPFPTSTMDWRVPEPTMPPGITLVAESVPTTRWLQPATGSAYAGPLSFAWPENCDVPMEWSTYSHDEWEMAGDRTHTEQITMSISLADDGGRTIRFVGTDPNSSVLPLPAMSIDSRGFFAAFIELATFRQQLADAGRPVDPAVTDDALVFTKRFVERQLWNPMVAGWSSFRSVAAGDADVAAMRPELGWLPVWEGAPYAMWLDSLPAPDGRAHLRLTLTGSGDGYADYIAEHFDEYPAYAERLRFDTLVDPLTLRPEYASAQDIDHAFRYGATVSNVETTTWSFDWSQC